MRQIVLDTETTGLEWKKGNRIVEIGCVEMIERRPTGNTWQQYIRPDCDFELGAAEVTGLSRDFLADKPPFEDIADAFLAFIDGSELIIHNAAFDLGFLDAELSRLPGPQRMMRERVQVVDSLELARQRFPGQRNSLDALCRRLGVDNAHRQLHGALLDAQLLAEVYLALTSGQEEIGFATVEHAPAPIRRTEITPELLATPRRRIEASPDELARHAARLDSIRQKSGRCIWDEQGPA